MRRSEAFELPQRQSQFAIIFIVLRFIRRIIRQTWPIFLALALGRSNSTFDLIEFSIAGLGIIGMITSIVAYFKYYFHLTDSELVISHGILKKVKQNIPFERIQSVNFRQTFIHQFLKVTEVEIETAGSAQQETKIDAIEIPIAEQLRERILKKKAEISSKEDPEESSQSITEEDRKTILRLFPQQLYKVGLVQNHFRPIGLLLGLAGTMIGYSYTYDFDDEFFPKMIYNSAEDFMAEIASFQSLPTLIYVLMGLLVLIIASVLYSIIVTILRHYNLHFWRSGKKFQLVQGLLTRNEFAALDNKIQILNWGQNPFERLVGFYNIGFKQARSGDETRKQSQFGIPGCQQEHVDFVRDEWLGEDSGKFETYHKVSFHYFLRSAFYLSLLFGTISIVNFLFGKLIVAVIIAVIWLIQIGLLWANYKKKRYAINDRELYIGGGTVGFRHSIIPLYKVQNVSVVQNPYQWRRKLATLVVNTAGGRIRLPYIMENDAYSIMDRLNYHVENSKKPWM